MNSRNKNAIYSVVLIIAVGSVWLYRNADTPTAKTPIADERLLHLKGVTMGVVAYNIKYYQEANTTNYQQEIDELLGAFNQSLSHYISDSEISRFNQSDTGIELNSRFFYPVMQMSEEVYRKTEGAFDPTVSPLINAWGFGPDKSLAKNDSLSIDSLLQLVGFSQIEFNEKELKKTKPEITLNFSAVAKGYAVDIVAELLDQKGIKNYMVEIGREVQCRGVNTEGEAWRIGIVNPNYKTQPRQMLNATVALENMSLATSGNYETFYIKDGKKYAHTISPFTGYPVDHNLLSASVFAPNCTIADAYATALMVLGTEKSKEILNSTPNLEGILIYEEKGEIKTYITKKLKDKVNQIM